MPRRTNGRHLLEVAARPIGGLCSKALRFVSPTARRSLEEVLLRHALRQDVTAFTREPRASGVMMIPIPHRGVYKGVQGATRRARSRDVDDVQITAKPDAAARCRCPKGSSYLGFIFARGTTPLARGAGAARRTRAAALRDRRERFRCVRTNELKRKSYFVCCGT